MALPDAATAYYQAQQRVSASTLVLARRLWATLGQGDFDQAWRALGPQLMVVLMAGQQASAAQAVAYVPAVLNELNIDAEPVAQVSVRSLVGVASDGRPLDSLLYQTVVRTRTALGQGETLAASLQSGGALLDDIVAMQVVDAGRAAETLESVVRPKVTRYARMLVPPSCARCAILAGHVYGWHADFKRHPGCDCRKIPANESVAGDLTTDPRAAVESGRVTGLSKADTQAVLDGADPRKVVNSSRGMYSEQGLKLTREGTMTKGAKRVRLRPESIYKITGNDRAEALRLLQHHGYVLSEAKARATAPPKAAVTTGPHKFDPTPFRAAATPAEAGARLQAAMGTRGTVSGFDSKGLDGDKVRQVAETAARLFHEYPDVRADILVTQIKNPKVFAQAGGPRAADGSYPNLRMEIAASKLKAGTKADATFARSAASGHFHVHDIPGTDSMAYTINHEFGHLVDFTKGATLNPYKLHLDELSRLGIRRASVEDRDWSRGNISGYGKTSRFEMIAEAFADVQVNGAKAFPFSHVVTNALTAQPARIAR